MKQQTAHRADRMLKAAGLYRTKGRIALLDALIRASRPLTQDQIARRMRRDSLTKVNIYRTLASLEQVGLVHRAYLQDRAWHFELAHKCSEVQCHPHFTCTGCGKTHCLTEVSVPLAKGQPKGFIIQRQQVRLEGLCPACA